MKSPANTHLYYSRHFISAVLLKYVSALKGPYSEKTTDTFSQPDQQNLYQM